MTARLLAAAEVYQALARGAALSQRPFSPSRPRRCLRDEVIAGRLDAAAVDAVLAAAGHRTRRRPALVAGLSAREAEVLVLLVRGMPNKRIATTLSISPRTVGSHVEHIYTKIGVSTRGSAAMFAMRHGIVDATTSNAEMLEEFG